MINVYQYFNITFHELLFSVCHIEDPIAVYLMRCVLSWESACYSNSYYCNK